jgi:MarR family transcriptional regulator, temperature-dependent positive regulator of motility
MDKMNAVQFAKVWSKLSKDLKAQMEASLAPHLTESQLNVLEYLLVERQQPLKPSDLLEYLETTPAAVTTLLDRMEKNELISRERDEKDRRIVWIQVTERGKDECHRGMEIRKQLMDTYLNRISAHNQQLLLYLLGKVAN